jgi:hypothetical protein
MQVKSQFLIMAAPAHDGGNIEIDKDQQNEDGSELENGLAAEARALPPAAKENSNASGVQSVCVLFRSRARCKNIIIIYVHAYVHAHAAECT